MMLNRFSANRNTGRHRPRATSFAKPSLELLEIRALLSTVTADLQTFYLNDTIQKFNATSDSSSDGPAVFTGTTANTTDLINQSDGSWSSGSITLGEFGSAEFQTVAVGTTHRNYFVNIIPASGGPNLTGLTATVYGKDFLGNDEQFTVPLPDTNGSISSTQVFGNVRPNDGSSSLDPSVVLTQLENEFNISQLFDQTEADLEAQQQLILNQADADALDAVKEGMIGALEVASAELTLGAGAVGFAKLLDAFSAVVNFGDAFAEYAALAFTSCTLSDTLEAQNNALSALNASIGASAAKTFYPTRVVVNGTSDDTGSSAVVIGGPGQTYHNVFTFNGAAGHTSGTTTFYDQFGQIIASGPIDTQNYYNSDGTLLVSKSKISLPQGTIDRVANFTGSPITQDNSDGTVTSIYPSIFNFSNDAGANGTFSEGLTGFTTTGEVTTTSAPDGSDAVLISEDPASSLASVETIPNGASPLLAMDLKWMGALNSSENATFTVDFTTPQFGTTVLYTSHATDPSLHGDRTTDLVISIPDYLEDQTGVLRFLLNPSSTDGVESQVMLGGFTLSSVYPPSTLYELNNDSGSFDDSTAFSLRGIDPQTGAESSAIALVVPPNVYQVDSVLAVNPLTSQLYTLVEDQTDYLQHLATIDPESGVVTELGATGYDPYAGLTFDSSGTLYAEASYGGSDLVTIDPQSGAYLGDVAYLTGGFESGAIAFNRQDGLIYHLAEDYSNDLVFESVDPSGDVPSYYRSVNQIPLTGDFPTSVGSLAYVPSLGELVASDANSSLYALTPEYDFDTGQFVVNGTTIGTVNHTPLALAEVDPADSLPQPPNAVIGGPYFATENSPITLNGANSYSYSSGNLTYEWDLNYDGLTFNVDATGSQPVVTFGDDPLSRYIALRVTDSAGLSSIATTFLYVAALPPTATFSNQGAVDEGSTGLVTFSEQSDPSPDNQTVGFSYSYDFNDDGTFEITGSTSATMIVPSQYFLVGPGTRTVRARITNADGAFTDYTTTIAINDVPPAVSTGSDVVLKAGDSLSRLGSFADPGLDTWTATVDYGDGSGIQTLSLNPDKTFGLNHAYLSSGNDVVTVKVTDGHGAVGTSSLHVSVVAPPTVQGFVVNDGSAQRSMVTSLTYTFSTLVNIDPGAFEVDRVGGGAVGLIVSTSTTASGQTRVVLDFSGSDIVGGSLADGRYTVTIHSQEIHETSPLALVLSADRVDSVFRLFGDADGNGVVDNSDMFLIRASINKSVGEIGYLALFDFDGNGTVDQADYNQLRNRFGKKI